MQKWMNGKSIGPMGKRMELKKIIGLKTMERLNATQSVTMKNMKQKCPLVPKKMHAKNQ